MNRFGGNPQPQRQGGRRSFGGTRFANGPPQGGQNFRQQNNFQPANKPQQAGPKPNPPNQQQNTPKPQSQPTTPKPQQQPTANAPAQQQNTPKPQQNPPQKPQVNVANTQATPNAQQNQPKPIQNQTPQQNANQKNIKNEPPTPNKPEQIKANNTPTPQANRNQPQQQGAGGNQPNQFQGNRPQGNKPQGPPGGNFQGNKPQDGPQGGNFQGNKPQGGPPGGNFQGNKPQDGPPGANFQGNKPQGGPPGGNFQGNKPQGGPPGGNFQGGQGGPQSGGNFHGGQQSGGNFQGGPGGNFQGGPGGNFQGMKRKSDFGGPRNQRPGPGGPGGPGAGGPRQGGGPGGMREEHFLAAKLKDLTGPLFDLPPVEQTEVKFNGRSRLYIGNLTNDITEDDLNTMFSPYGETSELFHNKEKNFAFIKMDYRSNAEKAKRELDGQVKNGRPIKVRFAPHNSAIRVKNLTPFVSNELLYISFEIFGKIERAYVKVDERGKSLCEGVVEFVRKPSALAAVRNCTEKCFFLTSSLKPVIVEPFEEPDEVDGYLEKNLPKRHPDFTRAREMGPRFSELNSFEHEYGTRWKQLHDLYKQKEEALKAEKLAEEDKLEAQMEYAKYEHETELLREQLRQREQDRDRQKRSWEMAERAADERRDMDRQNLLRQEQDMTDRMRRQDDELRRRQQENTLFVQAQKLSSLLDIQEQTIEQPFSGRNQGGGWNDMGGQRKFQDKFDEGSPRWENRSMQDDFPNKRRRF